MNCQTALLASSTDTKMSDRPRLHYALIYGDIASARILVDTNTERTHKQRSPNKRTSLHWAVVSGDLYCVKQLIKRDPKRAENADSFMETPLHWAASQDRPDILRAIISPDVDLDAADLDGWTALHWAAMQGHEQNIRVLVSEGADLEKQDDNQMKPSDIARYYGHIELADVMSQMELTDP